jgi:hypothetical protein
MFNLCIAIAMEGRFGSSSRAAPPPLSSQKVTVLSLPRRVFGAFGALFKHFSGAFYCFASFLYFSVTYALLSEPDKMAGPRSNTLNAFLIKVPLKNI